MLLRWTEKRYKLFQTSQGCVGRCFGLMQRCRISFLPDLHASFFRLTALNGKRCVILTVVAVKGYLYVEYCTGAGTGEKGFALAYELLQWNSGRWKIAESC